MTSPKRLSTALRLLEYCWLELEAAGLGVPPAERVEIATLLAKASRTYRRHPGHRSNIRPLAPVPPAAPQAIDAAKARPY